MSDELHAAVKALLESRGDCVETLFGTVGTVGFAELNALAHVFDGITGKLSKKLTVAGTGDACQQVFDHWVMRMNKQAGKCKLNQKRRAVITKMLKEGYTAEDMMGAIDGCARSRYHMGDNSNGTVYNSLELILRDGDKLEQFRDSVGVVVGGLPKSQTIGGGSTRDISLQDMASDRSWADS